MSTNVEPTASTKATKGLDATIAEEPLFRYYRPPQSAVPTRHDLPESYFTPSVADLKAAQASLSARTQALVNAPLRTQAMREAEDKTTIRIKFSDRSQLEKTFPSTDKIRSVYAFVRGSLREDVKPIKFVLYQTPPKREFKVSDPNVRDLSLAELQLTPSSVLLLRFENDELNHSDLSAPLDPSVLALAQDLPVPPNFDADFTREQSPAASTSAPPGQSSSENRAEKKISKWLKLGPKK
ncbi:hypothetical protein AcV7_006875 [Taiwanofungus camphoratus]|nr:hypothetical protein AcV7_006875 [Antrodia cinnamomea]